MILSIGQIARRSLFAGLVLSGMLLAWGCQDIITFANHSHEKGMGLYQERMYSDAAGAFRNAVRQDPRHYRSHFYLGVCYDQMGQHQQAFQQYWTALEVSAATAEGRADPEFRTQILDTLASAIARHDQQETELSKAASRAREKPSAENWFLLAKVHRLRGDADSAIDAYRRACHWDATNFAIRKEFGLYLLDPLGQKQDAEYYLKQAARINRTDEVVNAALVRLGGTIPVEPTPGLAPSRTVEVPRD